MKYLPLLLAILFIALLVTTENAVAQIEFETRALSGSPAPIGQPSVDFDEFRDPAIDSGGGVHLFAGLSGFVTPANQTGLFVSDGTDDSLLVRTGDTALAVSPSATFTNLGNVNSNQTGSSIYLAEFSGSGINVTNNQAVLSTSSSETSLIIQKGEFIAPGAAIDEFKFFDLSPIANPLGETAFVAILRGLAIDTSNDEAVVVYLLEEGGPQLIAREADPSPIEGFEYGSFPASPTFNRFGQTAFVAELRCVNDVNQLSGGVFRSENSKVLPIAVEGDVAPIEGGQVIFGGVPGQVFAANTGFNDAGEVLFVASLAGPSVTEDNDSGIFCYSNGQIQTIGRSGDLIAGTSGCVLGDITGTPVVTQNSRMAFRGQLCQVGEAGFREGIYFVESDTLQLLVSEDDPAPDTSPGVVFGSPFVGNNFGDPVINSFGQIAFFGMLQGAGIDNGNNQGIWATDALGQLRLVVQSGQTINVSSNQAPDIRTIQFVGKFRPSGGQDGQPRVLNNSGRLVFCVQFTDGSQAVVRADTLGLLPLETRLLSGEQAPVAVDPVVFDTGTFDLEVGFIDNVGQVAFQADVEGPGIDSSNERALFAGTVGNLTVVAREGDLATSLPGMEIDDIENYNLSRNGNLMYQARVEDLNSSAAHCALYQFRGESHLIGIEDQPLFDDLPEVILAGFGLGVANSLGQVAFYATYSGDNIDFSNDEAIVICSNAGCEQIISELQSILGIANVELQSFQEPDHFFDSGEFAITGRISGPDVTIDDNDVILKYSNGNLELVARQGDTAPFLEPGVYFEGLFETRLQADDRISIFARLDGPGINISNEEMLVEYFQGTLSSLVRDGDLFPNSDVEIRLGSSNEFAQNDFGQYALRAGLVGPNVDSSNDFAIVLIDDGELNMIAREGDPAPGTEPEVVFSSFGVPNINNLGQLVFEANVAGPGINSSNNVGLWVAGTDGQLSLVVREGDLFDVDDDPNINDFRVTSSFEIPFTQSGGNDGRPAFLNDRGQIVLKMRFNVGMPGLAQGIFVANTLPLKVLLGDVNRDGVVDLLDIQPFIELLNNGGYQLEADMNQDGQVDLLDVSLFVNAINEN